MRVDDHEIEITRGEIEWLWIEAFAAPYPAEMDIVDGLKSVMATYGVQGMKRKLLELT